jgi:hypothetical protein
MRARSTRLAGSVRERAIDISLAKSSSPSDNSIARRHAVMTFDLILRIRSQPTKHRNPGESHTNDPFHGIDGLDRMIAFPEGGPSSDMQRCEG